MNNVQKQNSSDKVDFLIMKELYFEIQRIKFIIQLPDGKKNNNNKSYSKAFYFIKKKNCSLLKIEPLRMKMVHGICRYSSLRT